MLRHKVSDVGLVFEVMLSSLLGNQDMMAGASVTL